MAAGVATIGLFLSKYVVARVWAGFWAMTAPSSGRVERTLKPASVSSEERDWSADDMFRRCSVPKGLSAART